MCKYVYFCILKLFHCAQCNVQLACDDVRISYFALILISWQFWWNITRKKLYEVALVLSKFQWILKDTKLRKYNQKEYIIKLKLQWLNALAYTKIHLFQKLNDLGYRILNFFGLFLKNRENLLILLFIIHEKVWN